MQLANTILPGIDQYCLLLQVNPIKVGGLGIWLHLTQLEERIIVNQ